MQGISVPLAVGGWKHQLGPLAPANGDRGGPIAYWGLYPSCGRAKHRGQNRGFRRSDEWFHLISGGYDGQEFTVALIGEEPTGSGQTQPAELIDLHIDREGAPFGGHHPVGHHLGAALAVGVLGMADEAEEPAGQARLLLHFSLGRFLVGLALFELALGKGPIRLGRTVHQRDLQFALAPPDQQTAGGLHHLGRRRGLNRHRMPSHPLHPTAAPGENRGNQRTPGVIRGQVALAL
jgi:hypothetical protein